MEVKRTERSFKANKIALECFRNNFYELRDGPELLKPIQNFKETKMKTVSFC